MERQQIISSAFDLFAQHGIKKVSMNDIANKLNISKRTLYQLFDDKESLIVDGLEYRNNQLKNIWKELEKGPYNVLETILLFSRKITTQSQWFTPKFYEELNLLPKAAEISRTQGKEFEKKCMELLSLGVKEGVFEENVNWGIIVKLAKKHVKMYPPSKSFSDYSNIEVYYTIFYAFLRGISTEKGRQIIERWIISNKHYSINFH